MTSIDWPERDVVAETDINLEFVACFPLILNVKAIFPSAVGGDVQVTAIHARWQAQYARCERIPSRQRTLQIGCGGCTIGIVDEQDRLTIVVRIDVQAHLQRMSSRHTGEVRRTLIN